MVSVDATINRADQQATNPTRPEGNTGAGSNDTNLGAGTVHSEPVDHGMGRFRGGLTNKSSHAVDG